MIRIAIVDDETAIVNQLKLIVEACIKEKTGSYEIKTFTSGAGLLEDDDAYNLVFLDIEMPGMDGYETGRLLREKCPQCEIIIATADRSRFKEAFNIRAFRYITKSFDEKEIREAVHSYVDEKMKIEEEIMVYSDRIPCYIRQKDIQYIEAYDGYVNIYACGKKYRAESTINEYEKILNSDYFYRISRSFILNFLYVRKNPRGIFIIGEKEFKIPRKRVTEVKEAFIAFEVAHGKEKRCK